VLRQRFRLVGYDLLPEGSHQTFRFPCRPAGVAASATFAIHAIVHTTALDTTVVPALPPYAAIVFRGRTDDIHAMMLEQLRDMTELVY
jgi:hypothetical protein